MKKTINFKFSIAKKINHAIIEYESQIKSKSEKVNKVKCENLRFNRTIYR